jgi:hypothetical protein
VTNSDVRMKNIKFQYYPGNIKKTTAIGYVDLFQFIRAHREPKKHLVDLFTQISYYESIGDKKTKAKLKERLYSFTPCVVIKNKRSYSDILSFTGLLVLDFDHIHNAPEFKEYLFHEYKYIIAAWLSPSKHGVKALVKIPVVNTIDEFKAYYYGIGNKMWEYNGFDGSGQNCVLPLFQSYDPDLLARDNPETWHIKGEKFNELNQDILMPPDPVEPKTENEAIIKKMIDTGMSKIDDNGHPQLRGLCIAIGGYVSNGYIGYFVALKHIQQAITYHKYLRKGISGYQKTVEWALNEGMKRPMHLTNIN